MSIKIKNCIIFSVGCIPICNDEKNVVGVLTDRDIVLRSVACDKNAKTTPVSEIMTTNVYTCKSEQDIEDAQYLMEQNQVRRIPIVDNTNKMVGILSTGDLAHHNQKIGEDSFSTIDFWEEAYNCREKIEEFEELINWIRRQQEHPQEK